MTMSEEKNKKTVSMYDLADELLPRHQWCIGTDEVAEQLADLIVEHGCAVRYDKETKPQIDAAVLCDPYDEEEVLRDRLSQLRDGEWIILLHQRGYPIKPDGTLDDEAVDYAELLTYDSCVRRAEHCLSSLLRRSIFVFRLYMIYLSAAFAIARGNHPDWTFDTFIGHFMKDIVDRMIIRTKRNN